MLAALNAATRRMPQTNRREGPGNQGCFLLCMSKPPKGISNGGRQDQLPNLVRRTCNAFNWRIFATREPAPRSKTDLFWFYATIGAANAGAATNAAAPRNRGCSSTDTVLISVRAARSVRARSARAAFTDDSIKSQAAVISPPI